MATLPFNINDDVRVRFTQHGLELLKARHDDLCRQCPNVCWGEFTPPVMDSDGWCKFQLWDLMHQFGKHIYNGCKVPFETEILIEVDSGKAEALLWKQKGEK